MQKKYIIFRIIFSLSILGFLITRIDLDLFLTTLKKFSPGFYLLAVILLFLQQYTFGIGWRIALESKGYGFRSIQIFKAILTSSFLGIIFPSTFAGDIILTFNIGRAIPQRHHAPSALLYIRMLNMLFLLVISVIFLNTVPQLIIFRYILIWILFCILLSYLIIFCWLKYFSWMEKHYVTNFIYKTFSSFTEFSRKLITIVKIVPIILITTLARIFLDYLLALSLGIELPLNCFFAMVPIVIILSTIPISIAGLGIREGIYVYLFGLIGMPKTLGFSISILVFSLSICSALTGGIIYLIIGNRLKRYSA